jgi:hypothetical protein
MDDTWHPLELFIKKGGSKQLPLTSGCLETIIVLK